MVLLTLDVSESSCANRLRIRRGRQCAWVTAAMQESFSFSLKSHIPSDGGRRMLKTSLILLCISSWIKAVISGLQVEVYGPLEMAVSSAWGDHGGPV